MEQRAAIKFCFKSEKTAIETYKLMQKAYWRDCLSRAAVSLWFRRFKEGRQSLEDDKREGRPSTSCTESNVVSVRFLLANERCLTIRLIADELRRHGSTFETDSTCPSRALPIGWMIPPSRQCTRAFVVHRHPISG
ncbi:Putative uncharacterized protein FLJ37770 [Habropoda laboriosa]|uniref:Mos1 transposase HTH domain-containing protein n=1 Tax=Habropoda laboriosa TaxID=597456 RepID=A0A0L7QZS2_9HYME|nr:Putative uncharacterized protein FLJ37770 [Habropoda laboriosa]